MLNFRIFLILLVVMAVFSTQSIETILPVLQGIEANEIVCRIYDSSSEKPIWTETYTILDGEVISGDTYFVPEIEDGDYYLEILADGEPYGSPISFSTLRELRMIMSAGDGADDIPSEPGDIMDPMSFTLTLGGPDATDITHFRGMVGIGTATPTNRLTLYDGSIEHHATGPGQVIRLRKDGISQNYSLWLQPDGERLMIVTSDFGRGIRIEPSGFVGINTTGALQGLLDVDNKFVVKNAGNVGIGTISPSAQLHTTGSVRFEGIDPADGRILTSDELGNAAWQDISTAGLVSGSGDENLVTIWGADNTLTSDYGLAFSADPAIHHKQLTVSEMNSASLVSYQSSLVSSSAISITAFAGNTYLHARDDFGDPVPIIITQGDEASPIERLRIDGDGNVGIGTDSPSAQLHTTGSVRLEGAGTPGDGKVLTSDEDGNATWQEVSGSADAESKWGQIEDDIYSLNDGNVGIGTDSPGHKLHVAGGLNAGNIRLDNRGAIVWGDASGASFIDGVLRLRNDNSFQIRGAGIRFLNGGNNQVAFLDNSGNLGLGTPSPSAQLHITGSVRFEGIDPADGRVLTSDELGNATWQDISTAGFVTGSGSPTRLALWETENSLNSDANLTWDSGELNVNSLRIHGDGSFNYIDGDVELQLTSSTASITLCEDDYIIYDVDNNEFNGNVYIGYSPYSHASQLHVRTDGNGARIHTHSTSSDNYAFEVATGLHTSPNHLLYARADGNIGLGTSDPALRLDIRGSNPKATNALERIVHIASTDATDPLALRFGLQTHSSAGIRHGAIDVMEGETNRNLTLQRTGGRVGIGCYPEAPLLAVGQGNTGFLVPETSHFSIWVGGGERIRIAGTDVGIGTSSPSQRLHVAGDVNVSSGQGYRINNTATSGHFLRGNGTRFVSSAIQAADIPSGSGSYIQNQSGTNQTANFRISGNGLIAGNVGIGTTSPSYRLHLYGTSNNAADVYSQTDAGRVIKHWFVNSGRSWSIGQLGTTVAPNYQFRITDETASTARLVVNTDGNVGIGTTNPRRRLHISGLNTSTAGSDGIFMDIQNTSNTNGTLTGIRFKNYSSTTDDYYKGAIFFERDDPVGWGRGNMHFATYQTGVATGNVSKSDARMTISSQGWIGINNTSPEYRLDLLQSTQYGAARIINDFNNPDAVGLLVSTAHSSSYILNLANVGTSRMYVRADGNVGLGTTSPSFQLHLSQNSAAKPLSSSWTVSSDKRLKKDIIEYESGLEDILKINPIWFTYTGEAGMPNETGVGVVAQELERVAPYMIKSWTYEDDNGNQTEYLGVDNSAMTYMLINAVKEQNEKIENQEKTIAELQEEVERLRTLETRIRALESN